MPSLLLFLTLHSHRRCFDVLGFDEYIESHADGLQILRYNLTTAYLPHMDWIDGNDQLEHDYESGQLGGNRFATILLCTYYRCIRAVKTLVALVISIWIRYHLHC